MPWPSSSHDTHPQARPSAYYIPKDAHEAIQGLEADEALDTLIKGAVGGLWPVEVVATWRAAQRTGKGVVTKVLRPLPKAMLVALATASEDERGVVVMRGKRDGLWTQADVDAYFENLQAYSDRRRVPSRREMVYRTRRAGLRPKPPCRPTQSGSVTISMKHCPIGEIRE